MKFKKLKIHFKNSFSLNGPDIKIGKSIFVFQIINTFESKWESRQSHLSCAQNLKCFPCVSHGSTAISSQQTLWKLHNTQIVGQRKPDNLIENS